MTDKLEILTWNCHSLYTKLSHFKITLYSKKPHIVCLCETWLKENRLPNFINYKPFFLCRQNRPGGGIAILVRSDICVKKIDLVDYVNSVLEVQAVTIYSNDKKLDILNIYNPNVNVSVGEFEHYFGQLCQDKVIVGDFNAHNNMWDTNSIENSSGDSLCQVLLNDPNLCLLTPTNFPTYFHTATRKFSTLDLCFVSSSLMSSSNVFLGEDMGSDHCPLKISINFKPDLTPFKRRKRWIFGNSKTWSDWRGALPVRTENESSLENSYNKFLQSLSDTSRKFFKSTKEIVNPKYSKTWWNQECEFYIKIRRNKKNIFHKHPTVENLVALRRAEADVKRITKKAKKDSFKNFSNVLTKDTPSGIIWKQIGRLTGKANKTYSQPINHNNQIITNSNHKANIIAEHYSSIFNNQFQGIGNNNFLLHITFALIDETEFDYNCKFIMNELICAISTLKDTTAGHDFLHNQMLKNLPIQYHKWILDIANESFNSSIILPDWKLAIILPILKPEKSPSEPSAYRPISLLPCFSKLIERLVCNRLNYVLEQGNRLSKTQGGFRRRMCTLDQISRLENSVRDALYNRQICIAVFFDISHAYDGIWHLGLLSELVRLNIRGKMLGWIREYLSNRKFQVYFEGEYSDKFDMSSGVPQGSILAPTLFNIMMSSIPHSENVKMAEYADDIVMFSSGSEIEELKVSIQRHIDKLSEWFFKWGFKLNKNKTKAMMFTLKKLDEPRILIEDNPIEFVSNYKYLGIIFDKPRLTWVPQIKYIINKCIPKMNILKSVSNHHWGADREVLLKLYKSLIRSILDYGSIFYMTASKTHLNKLNKIQNNCLRLAIGARKTSPILSLEVESNVPPLFLHRNTNLLKFYFRLCELPNNVPVTEELFQSAVEQFHKAWSSTVRMPPVIIRCWQAMMKCQFPVPQTQFTELVSPIPPWVDFNFFVKPDIESMPSKQDLSEMQIQSVFNYLKEKQYKHFMEIYTDGSVMSENELSTSAALVIFGETHIYEGWKLNPIISILGAELFAIYKALEYLSREVQHAAGGVVIFSDSQSGLYSILNKRSKTHINLVYRIQNLLLDLNFRYKVIIQFIPSHRGIVGNELADTGARSAHGLTHITESPICKREKARLLTRKQISEWQEYWYDKVESTNKGKHLKLIKENISFWPWASHSVRTIETALAKLRIGHVGLNSHIARFEMRDSDLCSCGSVETVEHFFLSCPDLLDIRDILNRRLRLLNVPMNLRNLLGGGYFDEKKQKSIIYAVVEYLHKSDKLNNF